MTVLAATLVACLLGTAPTAAQIGPEGSGVVEAALTLRQLDGVKRVLMIGAHPDDEDTGLLTTLARGMGVETAYLSLTRGDGGQNLIGPELGEGLGIIRTGELEAARRLDGGRQFFTRAYDYGFSKSADEAFAHWPRDEVLRDIVWVIRTFRPQVIVSVWTRTPRDGHGQHQATGILVREAFGVANDPSRFADLPGGAGQPWRAEKLYHSVRRSPEPPPVTVPIGTFDPLLGRSYLQLAMESRSQHRSQDMGAPQPLGPREAGLRLVESHVQEPAGDDGIFAGVDTTLPPLEYPEHFEVRKVSTNGGIRWHSRWINISSALGNEFVGLEPIGPALWQLYFGPTTLGWFDEELFVIFDTHGNTGRNPIC